MERLDAVDELGQSKNKQIIDVLTHRIVGDPIYKVQEAAYHKLKELGEQKTDHQELREKKFLIILSDLKSKVIVPTRIAICLHNIY